MPRAHVYYGQKPAEPAFVYKEFTLGELVRIVKRDNASFPLGLKTKLSLGDFEGNTYHRKFSVRKSIFKAPMA